MHRPGERVEHTSPKRKRGSVLPSLALRAGMLVLLLPAPLCAHDGGFGHSRRTIHVVTAEKELRLEYRVLQNRDEALVELVRMDADRDGKVSAEERDRYFNARGRQIAGSLVGRTGQGEAVPIKFIRFELSSTLGQTYHFTLDTTAREVLLDDRVFPHKPGLVQVRHGAGLKVEQARPVNLAHAERVSLRIRRVD
jgi:hypothetical protein